MTIGLLLMAWLAYRDWLTRRIPNVIVLPGIVLGLAIGREWFAAAVMFSAMLLLYTYGVWGGGDVKLAVMSAAFLGHVALLAVSLTLVLIVLWRLLGHHGALAVGPLLFVSACGICGILRAFGA